ncbi:hypothetical protein KM043_004253 [Ampulex compressa]|nr:hypothetical protein KM043_004253 [Ampulex compressa]
MQYANYNNTMLCARYAKRNNAAALLNLVLKQRYSRRSDKSTSSYKVVNSNGETLDDIDSAVLGTNLNWELLTPRGFRFYLPGSIGPGWLNATTTAPVKVEFVSQCENNGLKNITKTNSKPQHNVKNTSPILQCVAQNCPLLLREGIRELFPGCLDVPVPQLTIVTLSQKVKVKVARWNSEVEFENLAKYFVLAASDICKKLKMVGYWADFINPFSGQPHLSQQKNSTLYETDERFRCLGFKIEQKNNCRMIVHDNNVRNFVGSLYTTAPPDTEFLKELMSNYEFVNVDETE